MSYRRRTQQPAQEFAWPPTREDLDLIEVVDADTLRPVRALCDEPEAPAAAEPNLLKTVAPTRPAAPLLIDDISYAPAPLVPTQRMPLPVRARDAVRNTAQSLIAHTTAMRPTVRLDRSAFATAGAVLAIVLSAYLSLTVPPLPSRGSEYAIAAAGAGEPRIARPIPQPLSSVVISSNSPIARAPLQPQAEHARSRLDVRPATFMQRSSSAAPMKRGESTTAVRLVPEPRPTAPQPNLSSSTPAAERVPAITNASFSIPTSSSTLPSLIEASNRVRDLAPPPAVHPAPVHPAPVHAAPEPTASARASRDPAQSQQQIYAALHQYERAYERLDANAVRAVWPSVDARALARAFHDLKSQTLVFDRCDIDVASVQAIAACRGRATYETRVGQQAMRSEPREWTFKLQKNDEAWRIVSAVAR